MLCSGLGVQVKRLNWLLDLVTQKLFMNWTKGKFNGLGDKPDWSGFKRAEKMEITRENDA